MNLSDRIFYLAGHGGVLRDVTTFLKSRHLAKDKVSAYQLTLPLVIGTMTTIVAYNAGFPNLTPGNVFTPRVHDFLRTRVPSRELLKVAAGLVNPTLVDLGKKIEIPTLGFILIDHNGSVAYED